MRGRFDLVLVDAPPNIRLCTWASLGVTDHAVVPLQPEGFGCPGATTVKAAVGTVRETLNPRLKLAGFVANLVDKRAAVHRAREEARRAASGGAA